MADASNPEERFLRILGKRRPAAAGRPPSAAARAAMTAMAQYRTCVPKGVFIYASHGAANADWDDWRTKGMLLTKEGMREKDRADRAVLLRALEATRK